MVVSTL